VKLYDKQIQALYHEKDANGKKINTPKNLYVLFMVLPFLHVGSGVLCKKPLSDNVDCEPFTLKELAELFGFSRINLLKAKLLIYMEMAYLPY